MAGRRTVVVAASLGLGCCLTVSVIAGAGLASAARSQAGGVFRISLHAAAGIDYMDPALASSPPGWALLDTTCARLMSYPDKPPPEGFRLRPEVAAAAPALSRDGTTYTFK